MSFLIPTFVPRTVTDLTCQLNEETELSKKEALLRKQFAEIRDHQKHTRPLGVIPTANIVGDDQEDPDDDSMTDDMSHGSQGSHQADDAELDKQARSMASQVRELKWVRGTKFIVDGFRFQDPECRTYFLTHCHSDHTTGLQRDFSAGEIYCTPISAALLTRDMRIPAARIVPVPLDEKHTLDGVDFTFIDANHCPGAAMILFEIPIKDGSGRKQVILHTGDMRWQHSMVEHPALRRVQVDILYMDTTYAAPKHLHPPQDIAIAKMVELMRQHTEKEPATLFVVGSYHIGKERAYIGPARALGWRIYCPAAKLRVLKLLNLPDADMAVFTSSPVEARIHVGFMGKDLLPETLSEKIRDGPWTHVVAFRPTGWTYRRSGKLETRKEGVATVYGIPYSEHSNFAELRDCVASLRPKRLIPTVNVTDKASLRRLVDRFAECMDLSTDRSRMDCYFRGSRLRKPEGALSAPADLQLTADADAEPSDDDNNADEAEATPAPAGTAKRERSCGADMDDSESDSDDVEPGGAVAGAEGARTPPCTDFVSGAAAPSNQPCLTLVVRAERSSSLSSGDCPVNEPQRSQLISKAASGAEDSAASAATKAAMRSAGEALSAEVKREAADVKHEPEESPYPCDVDLREQAVLMALFEDRQRSSRDAAVAAAFAKAGRTPSQVSAAETLSQTDRRRLGRSVSAPVAAEADAESAAKRQRTLRGFFQVLQRG